MKREELLIIIIATALLISFSFAEFGSRVYIDSFYFNSILHEYYSQVMFSHQSLIQCSVACLCQSIWCVVYCYDNNTKICLLTNLMVSPYHQDSEARSVKCHTLLEKDLAYGSDVESSGISDNFSPNATRALARGIYNYNWRQTCTGVLYNYDAYILFDLKHTYGIREIRITTQPGAYEYDLPKGTLIKVGKKKPISNGNFSDYAYFATIPQYVKEHETYVLTSEKESRVYGRYVAFAVANGRGGLSLCYVQIFE